MTTMRLGSRPLKGSPLRTLLALAAALAVSFASGFHAATIYTHGGARQQPRASGGAAVAVPAAEVGAATAAATAAASIAAAASTKPAASGQRARRPPEYDMQPDSGRLGLDAARAAAAADAVQPPVLPGVIPRNFHRIYIADPADEKRRNFTLPIAHQAWIETCQQHFSKRAGWTYYFWDYAAAEALIANHFPWFLPFYRHNASKAIEKSDLVRYAILHRIGGLYLDSDIECWRESYDMLAGFDFVAQATHSGEGATNAAIAARPGLEVFPKALELVQTRKIDTDANAIKVIARTGPDLLTDALVAVGLKRTDGMFAPNYDVGGVAYRLWRVGKWFQPCQWWEQECRRRIYAERASGRYSIWHVAGFHRMVGSWIPGKEDGIGILNVTAELCGVADHVRGNGLPGGWVAPNKVLEKKLAGAAGGNGSAASRRALSEAWND